MLLGEGELMRPSCLGAKTTDLPTRSRESVGCNYSVNNMKIFGIMGAMTLLASQIRI